MCHLHLWHFVDMFQYNDGSLYIFFDPKEFVFAQADSQDLHTTCNEGDIPLEKR